MRETMNCANDNENSHQDVANDLDNNLQERCFCHGHHIPVEGASQSAKGTAQCIERQQCLKAILLRLRSTSLLGVTNLEQ
jgi:hypothetical protein